MNVAFGTVYIQLYVHKPLNRSYTDPAMQQIIHNLLKTVDNSVIN